MTPNDFILFLQTQLGKVMCQTLTFFSDQCGHLFLFKRIISLTSLHTHTHTHTHTHICSKVDFDKRHVGINEIIKIYIHFCDKRTNFCYICMINRVSSL